MTTEAIVRPVTEADAAGLLALAEVLDTMNLPGDPAAVAQLIAGSRAAFAGQPRGEGTFVLVAELAGRLVGTASLIARHGSPQKPHHYLEVISRPVRSESLDLSYIRHLLRLGTDETPRTELGGLVVHPDARGQGLGKLLLGARLLLIAAHRQWFCARLIAELLPPLRDDGGNAFWDAIGGRLTGLAYYRADRLCRADTTFISEVWPQGDVILELLPEPARAVLGQVGARTEPIRSLLQRVGFRYLNTVDPFDAGPHYGARCADVPAMAASSAATLSADAPRAELETMLCLTADLHIGLAGVQRDADVVRLAPEEAQRLGCAPGSSLWTMPWSW
ncbi:MAG: GNAT family N-acetyltransferase [Planctomycetota bacterium]|jgi:arginine N-succinyltransferase|nr:GNAT family N-acetyltransferase [Planctomycetota bacterium]